MRLEIFSNSNRLEKNGVRTSGADLHESGELASFKSTTIFPFLAAGE
jgi:hypothetical protein